MRGLAFGSGPFCVPCRTYCDAMGYGLQSSYSTTPPNTRGNPMHRIVIDQSKIRVDEGIARRGAAGFPRPLEWWQRTLPIWVSVSEGVDGNLILEPNGKVSDGRQEKLTPATIRSDLKAIRKYLDGRRFLDFSDAVIEG